MSSTTHVAKEINVDRQRALGIYYTPSSVAKILASWAIQTPSDTVLEPSFGGCALLSSAIERLQELHAKNPESQFLGFDVDPEAFVHLKGLFAKRDLSSSFFKSDFLLSTPSSFKVTAVIANPPFVSYHRMDKAQREIVSDWREKNSPRFPLTASLWAYFLVHAMSFLKKDGRMAFVLPSAAVSSDYAKHVIKAVSEKFRRIRIFQVQQQFFSDSGADERAVIMLAEGFQSSQGSQPLYFSALDIEDLQSSIDQKNESSVSPKNFEEANLIVQKLKEAGLCIQLGEVGSVAIGEVIGDTKYLAKPLADWKLLGIARDHLKPLLTRTRQAKGLTLSDRDLLDPHFPYLFHPKTARAQAVAAYLEKYPLAKREANATFSKRMHWYLASYETTADAFIGSLCHDSPKIISNTGKLSCANGLYKITTIKKSWNALLVAASVSSIFRWSAECHSRPMGAGAMKLEPSDVRKLLLPSISEKLSTSGEQLLKSLDDKIRNGKLTEAIDIADQVLFLQTNILTTVELEIIKTSLAHLQQRRKKKVQ
ncbi:N-6 DNA methylase [Variovorax sp. EBFNA2]|uniref:N-6 DNA methylase n=1 Tax=Variovorax sp. EBFNA2 TaxID=3342097 RepID=UPI0029C0A4C2|nr:N-6 DNA methylase [Variovorax boronicumulans]WPG38515.1 N-6 DNA methylase [Variovorax boronicumulans]